MPIYDKAWKVEEPNTFGTDEYINWCRIIGAEPYICTNAGTGTPEEMSDWVEYCNLNIGKYAIMRRENGHKDPYNVLYWSVGNENWGAHEIGAKTITEWGGLVRESSKMMRAVTPELKLFAAALPDTSWTVPLLKEAGYLLDYVSIHGYWDPLWAINNVSPYIDCMMRTTAPEDDIKRTIRILDETGFRGKINNTRTRFVLAAVNKSPEEAVDFRPDFKGLHMKIPKKITAIVLCGTTPDDFNDIGFEERVIPVQMQFEIINEAISLPPHSLTFFNFE